MPDTTAQYRQTVEHCKALFLKKAQDYGAAWRLLRPSSVTDQLFIKARRIRSLEEKRENRVGESIESEFIGIVNYGVIALLVLEETSSELVFDAAARPANIAELDAQYESKIKLAYDTMLAKNHDYDEVWRDMRVSSLTDLILVKLLRVKSIEDQQGQTRVSEGVDANYIDMINYAIFALIRLNERVIFAE